MRERVSDWTTDAVLEAISPSYIVCQPPHHLQYKPRVSHRVTYNAFILSDFTMPVPKYENRGPITATSTFDLKNLREKSVIITGGANGLGKAYAKAFVAAGYFFSLFLNEI